MSLVQKTQLKTGDLAKVTLQYGDQPVKLTVELKDGKQQVFTADDKDAKLALLVDAKVLQEKMGY